MYYHYMYVSSALEYQSAKKNLFPRLRYQFCCIMMQWNKTLTWQKSLLSSKCFFSKLQLKSLKSKKKKNPTSKMFYKLSKHALVKTVISKLKIHFIVCFIQGHG